MLDTMAIEQLVKQQIKEQVTEQIAVVLGSDEWLASFEKKIIEYIQARVLAKFANAEYLPQITDSIKSSVNELFKNGAVPGIDQYVDKTTIKQTIDVAVEQLVENSITHLGNDPAWLEKIERQINQAVIDRVVRQFGQIDLNPIIKTRVDENMSIFQQDILKNFVSTGISDQTTSCQLTVMDDTTVVENQLTAKDLEVIGTTTVKNFIVKGSINTDNRSWDELKDHVSELTLKKITDNWKSQLVDQVTEQIKSAGIDFENVTIGGQELVAGSCLSSRVTESNLQRVGNLQSLRVLGEASFNKNTLNVVNKRIGINTEAPEMALSVWDEEVSVVIGKNKAKQAYIGTNRDNSVAIGVNRVPQIELDVDGMTTIKKLRVGLHRISHDVQVPGYSGTRGDIVFNSNPGPSNVFAWVCLGGHRWQDLKSST